MYAVRTPPPTGQLFNSEHPSHAISGLCVFWSSGGIALSPQVNVFATSMQKKKTASKGQSRLVHHKKNWLFATQGVVRGYRPGHGL